MSDVEMRFAQCMKTLSAFCTETNALTATLNDLLTQELSRKEAGLPYIIAGNFRETSRVDESNWLYTDVGYSLPLKGKKKKKDEHEMYLSYQISMIGDGVAFDNNANPVLHVMHWNDALSFKDDYYMGYPLDPETPYRLEHNRLIVYGDDEGDWKSRGWTFSIRLLTLDSSQALLDRIIKPAMMLINKQPVLSALPDNLTGLVIYAGLESLSK